jgi:hypothetical protein
MKIIAIDPSYEDGGLGYAIMESPENLLLWGTTHSDTPKDASFEQKVAEALVALGQDILYCGLIGERRQLIIEMPEVWGGFKAAMSTKTGVLHKLFFFVGALWQWGRERELVPILIPVREWKGQLPKEITRKRVEDTFGIKTKNMHEADAIGLGLYYLRKVTQNDSTGIFQGTLWM